MFEIFENETKEMKSYCKKNHLEWFHSGGGFYHYLTYDKTKPQIGNASMFGWLINTHHEIESFDVPTKPTDFCRGGLWVEDVIEYYYEYYIFPKHSYINIDWATIKNKIFKHLEKIDLDDVFYDVHGNISIENIKLIDMIPIMNKVNIEIEKVLKMENDLINNFQVRIDYLKGYEDTKSKYFSLLEIDEWIDQEDFDQVIQLDIGDGFKIHGVSDIVYIERSK